MNDRVEAARLGAKTYLTAPFFAMLFVPKILRIFAVLLVAGAAAACDIETTPAEQNNMANNGDATNNGTDSEDDKEQAVDRKFVEERYGIAMSWFNYESSTHAVLPNANIYRLEKGGTSTVFRVESYYNGRGDSGYFSIERLIVGAAEETSLSFELASSIKDAPVCVDLADGAETACAEARHDLVFRIEYREVAPAGFAVSNPAIYVASHFSDAQASNTQDIEILHGSFDSLQAAAEAVDDTDAWTRYGDAKTHPDDSILHSHFHRLDLGDSSPAFLQASAAMKMIGWSMEKTGPTELNLSAHCVNLETTREAQALPLSSAAKSATLEFDENAVTLVSLCAEGGPEIVEVSSQPYRGLWPDSDTYDLVVDTLGDSPEIRLTPGHFVWSTGDNKIDADTVIPAGLWEDDDV